MSLESVLSEAIRRIGELERHCERMEAGEIVDVDTVDGLHAATGTGTGTVTAGNTKLCLAANIAAVTAAQKAVVTVTYKGSGYSERNFFVGRFWVRVGLADEATYAQHCAIYEVVATARHSGNVANKRSFTVTRHCYGAASGGWTPPATTDFALETVNQSQFQWSVDNVGSGHIDVDVVLFEGHNVASMSIAAA